MAIFLSPCKHVLAKAHLELELELDSSSQLQISYRQSTTTELQLLSSNRDEGLPPTPLLGQCLQKSFPFLVGAGGHGLPYFLCPRDLQLVSIRKHDGPSPSLQDSRIWSLFGSVTVTSSSYFPL